MPAGFKNHPSRTPAAAAENQIQGRTEACRYLVLLGMDPRLPDGEGSDAFKLAEGHPSVKSAALNLAAAVHRRAHRRSGDGGPGAGGLGGGTGPGGRPAERAPTAGSSAVVRGESEADDVEKGSMSTAGDAGDEERGAQPRRRSAAEACSWGKPFNLCLGVASPARIVGRCWLDRSRKIACTRRNQGRGARERLCCRRYSRTKAGVLLRGGGSCLRAPFRPAACSTPFRVPVFRVSHLAVALSVPTSLTRPLLPCHCPSPPNTSQAAS